jgi:hypothetical protein
MEESVILRKSLEEMTHVCNSYQQQLQQIVDQRNLLYRDYAATVLQMKAKCSALERSNEQLKLCAEDARAKLASLQAEQVSNKGQAEQASFAVETVILRHKLQKVGVACCHSLQKPVLTACVRFAQAVALIMQAESNVAKAQERLAAGQRHHQQQAWRSREVVMHSRARMRALMLANTELQRSLHNCRSQLVLAVPCSAYFMLLDRYTALTQAKCSLPPLHSEVAAAEQQDNHSKQLTQLEAEFLRACKRAAGAEERERQAKAALLHPAAELESQLAGDLQQRSIELAASQARVKQTEGKHQRLIEELQQAEALLLEAQGTLAQQAKSESQSFNVFHT